MYSGEINAILKNITGFVGVFPRDRIPKPKKLPAFYVVNYDSNDEPGEHWVAIHLFEPNEGEYFDPFGLPPLHPALREFMQTNCKSWTYSIKDIQHAQSIKCGSFCVNFVRERSRGLSYRTFLSKFERASLLNDRKLGELVKKSKTK